MATVIPAQPLEAAAFAPYGEIIRPRRATGQFENNPYDPETSGAEPALVLTHGTPRLWIMQLSRNGLDFTQMARHLRVSQCLGALQGKDWYIAVAPPEPTRSAPDLGQLAAFRIPGDCVIKLHVATWHAGPLFVHDECLFYNLENLDTNKRDFQAFALDGPCRIAP
jgi:ureidoglycolate hydrolase